MPSSQRISPQEALSLMRDEGYVYVDVRSVPEFELGHPIGAYNLPWQLVTGPGATPNPSFVETAQRAFGLDAKLIVGCHTSNRSARAAAALRDAGFSQVVEQRAGMAGAKDAFGGVSEPGWNALGLPTATHAAPGRSFAELTEATRA